MIMISSEAGINMARARDEFVKADEAVANDQKSWARYNRARALYEEACRYVADELMAQNFHSMEGDS